MQAWIAELDHLTDDNEKTEKLAGYWEHTDETDV